MRANGIRGILFFSLTLGLFSPSAAAAPHPIKLPAGFQFEVYASGMPGARFMTWSPQGDLMVSQPAAGKILLLRKQGTKVKVHAFATGLDRPHGLAWHEGALYVAESGAVLKLQPSSDGLRATKRSVLTRAIPEGGNHWTRTLGFGPDGKLYVSVGSSCNDCEETNDKRAAILRMNPDGSNLGIFARGLRNAVGFRWRPGTTELWATENSRDWLGDDLPPDELNLVREGGDYGWPYCYGKKVVDPAFIDRDRCAKTLPAALDFQAHSAPLGLCFYQGKGFPAAYQGDAFVVFHGSWNRSRPTGYKIVRVRFHDGRPTGYEDFATGWRTTSGTWGRPVDVIEGVDKGLYVSDDAGGRVYRISYRF